MRALTLTALALLACGGVVPSAVKVEDAEFSADLNVDLAASTAQSNGEYVRDLSVGEGGELGTGQTVSVVYSGWLSNGDLFDTSADGGFTFVYGQNQVIAGWEQGLGGMKRGGTRQLVIPPTLAYGANGASPAIPPNAVVVFSVELLDEVTGTPPTCHCGTEGGPALTALIGLLVWARRRKVW